MCHLTTCWSSRPPRCAASARCPDRSPRRRAFAHAAQRNATPWQRAPRTLEPMVAAFLWRAPAHGDVLHEPCVGVRPVQGLALASLTVVEQGDVTLFSHT